jgi:uncharacterized repeat protein (TIGR03803 family)
MKNVRAFHILNLRPAQNHKEGTATKSSALKTLCIVLVFCFATAAVSSAQTLTTLVNFATTNAPEGALVQGTDGNLYGTTSGTTDESTSGTVFKMTPSGTLTTLYSFCSKTGCVDGQYPLAGVVQASNGDFYGTTNVGGANSQGAVFQITPAGTFTTLYSFCVTTCADGGNPQAELVQASNGDLYGTTANGGIIDGNPSDGAQGTLFKITTAGVLTTLHTFCTRTGCPDGAHPVAKLVRGSDGFLYGTTSAGGPHGDGTVFKVNLLGNVTTLHSFDGTDGAVPVAGLVQATDGNFYGTTSQGGANSGCDTLTCGTAFKMTPAGTLTTLYSFCSEASCADGSRPTGALIQATDGNLYGTTYGFGSSNGTIFKIDSSGTLTTLHEFCLGDCTDGLDPYAGLLQATSGTFYGTTFGVEGDSDGTVYSFSVGLGPFIKTIPTFGMVGREVTILGNNLTGTTSVSFNGTAATFTVVSGSYIKTTVPAGATTGSVEVTTPGETLNSNVVFRVVP